MLVYECGCRGWLGGVADSIVDSDPFFRELKKLGVRFFNERASNRPIDLPGIEGRLRAKALIEKLKKLNGNVLPPPKNKKKHERYAEEVGGDYGKQESPWETEFDELEFERPEWNLDDIDIDNDL